MQAGKPFGIVPFGVEAQRILRLEKGHIIVGQDTDGLTHPAEANMEWALGKKKSFYVGKRADRHADGEGRDAQARRLRAARCRRRRRPRSAISSFATATSPAASPRSTRSPTLGKVVGLAYLPPDLAEPGKRFEIRVDGGRMVAAETVAVPFYDPENKRQEM